MIIKVGGKKVLLYREFVHVLDRTKQRTILIVFVLVKVLNENSQNQFCNIFSGLCGGKMKKIFVLKINKY